MKLIYPPLRFAEKTRRPGGRSRQAAIAAAAGGIEAAREHFAKEMAEAAGRIDEILATRTLIGVEELGAILNEAERVVTLAETFGHVIAALIAKSLCDLVLWLGEKGQADSEVFAVHMAAMRQVLPPKVATQEESQRLLDKVSRSLMDLGCVPREELRRKSLRNLGLLDTAKDSRFERLLDIARKEFDVPIATISLVDANRQWFKSSIGLDITGTLRSVAFCTYAIEDDGVFIVEDAALDARFSNNPQVTGAPNIRFYAGAPLRIADGERIGTVCLFDRHPRTLDEAGQKRLQELSRRIVALLENGAARGGEA